MTDDSAAEGPSPPGFHTSGTVEVAAVIVTYNSAGEIDGLLATLRGEASDVSLRVVVVDNSSSDDTLARVSAHPDVIVVRAGGNVGYAAGINLAMQHAGDASAILVLNPDLRIERGAIRALQARLRADPRIGVVAPLIIDETGERSISIFNEPNVVRAVVDALMGPIWPTRPAPLSEWVRDGRAYLKAHPIDWATGAALIIARETAVAVGEWDERFFLYSEETDFCRRVRDLGQTVWFEPEAVVRHAQGKSGTSEALDALLNVNRVRYMRKHSPHLSGLYRHAAILGALLRAGGSASQRLTARVLLDESLWRKLPHAEWTGAPREGRAVASIVIPAHNESSVISRTLTSLASAARDGTLDVVVACNGCTDDTAAKASEFAGVRVVEDEEPSKTGALNHGDEAAQVWPRIYLDADIELPSAAVPPLLRALESPGILAARPPFEYDTRGAAWPVRSYFRARMRVPALSQALWGAGIYSLTQAGHERLGRFPRVIADDVYVDRLFARSEIVIPGAPAVLVRTPRTTRDLLRVLTRARRGPAEQGVDSGGSTLRSLAESIRGPGSLWDASAYVVLTVIARRRARGGPPGWERDQSSREPSVA